MEIIKKIRSLGYRTDLLFPAFDGEILEREDHLVIRTPNNPTFYWGNFLLFFHPPQSEDFQRWRELFASEIGSPPHIRHQAFGWDVITADPGEVKQFLEAGFELNQMLVMSAQQVHPPRHIAQEVTIHPLNDPDDWQQAIENQVRCRESVEDESAFRTFRQRQMQRYQAMVAAGLGLWFGAFLGDQLVADLGIFHDQKLGRYQSVQTHPDFRGRGIAGTLVYQAGRIVLRSFNLQSLVIVADDDHPAARLYESLGFKSTEHQMGLEYYQ